MFVGGDGVRRRIMVVRGRILRSWLLGLYIAAQVVGLVPLIYEHTLNIYKELPIAGHVQLSNGTTQDNSDRQRGVKDDNDDWPKMFATEPRERFDSDCSVFFLTCYPAVIVAAVVSLLGHFAVGAAKSLITIRPWWSSGLEMTFVGAIEVVVS